MGIVKVDARAVRVPLATPVRFATRRVLARDYLVVTLSSTDGYEGHGYAYVGTSGGDVVARYLDAVLSDVQIGRAHV